MGITQKTRTGCTQVPQLPDDLYRRGQLASCDTSQLCALGPRLLYI